MYRHEVDFIDGVTGACSQIDIIYTDREYTAADYVLDCENNADSDFVEMLHSGSVVLVSIDEV